MIKNQVVIPYRDYEKLHQHLCNISGYLRTVCATKDPSIEILLGAIESARSEALVALDLLEEEDEC